MILEVLFAAMVVTIVIIFFILYNIAFMLSRIFQKHSKRITKLEQRVYNLEKLKDED